MRIRSFVAPISLLAMAANAAYAALSCVSPTIYVTVTAPILPSTTALAYSTIYVTSTTLASNSVSQFEASAHESGIRTSTNQAYTALPPQPSTESGYDFDVSGTTTTSRYPLTQAISVAIHLATETSKSLDLTVYKTISSLQPASSTSLANRDEGTGTVTIQSTVSTTQHFMSTTTLPQSSVTTRVTVSEGFDPGSVSVILLTGWNTTTAFASILTDSAVGASLSTEIPSSSVLITESSSNIATSHTRTSAFNDASSLGSFGIGDASAVTGISTLTNSTITSNVLGASNSASQLVSSILTLTTVTRTAASSIAVPPSSTYYANVSSTVFTSPSASPTICGEQGDFVLNFDEIPPLSADNNQTVTPMPIFSPYHQFYFSEGFVVVPPPTDPYLPSSGELLLELLPFVGPGDVLDYTGQIGSGKTQGLSCFHFNALGASVGCDSLGPPCDWQFTGYRIDTSTQTPMEITSLQLSTPACPGISAAETCVLVPVLLDESFQNLTSISINVTVAGEPKIWWMDDLILGWYDSSCEAGLCRQNYH